MSVGFPIKSSSSEQDIKNILTYLQTVDTGSSGPPGPPGPAGTAYGSVGNPYPYPGIYVIDDTGNPVIIGVNGGVVTVTTLTTGIYYASLWGLLANIE